MEIFVKDGDTRGQTADLLAALAKQ